MINFFKKNISNIVVLLGFFVFWLAISIYSKSFISGFHLIDDPQLFLINESLQAEGLLKTIDTFLISEMDVRLRPLHMSYFIAATMIMGINYSLWAFHNVVAASLTSFFTYLSGRNIGFSVLSSIIFTALTFLGFQSIIWFHLGHDELQGMLFMAFALFFMTKSSIAKTSQKRKNFYTFLFVLFTIIFSYAKEIFILAMPAFIFWKNLLDKKHSNLSWKEALKQNMFINIFLTGVFVLDLLLISLFMGTDKGYVGLSFDISKYFGSIYLFFAKYTLLKYILAALFLVIGIKSKFKFISILKENINEIILAFLIIIPQCIIYAKSGYYTRYLLPATLGYSFLTVHFYEILKAKYNNIKISKVFLSIVTIAVVSKLLSTTFIYAQSYAKEGINFHKTLNLIELITSKNSVIVISTDAIKEYEPAINIRFYLNRLKQRKNVYILPMITKKKFKNNEEELLQNLVEEFDYKVYQSIENKNSIACIVTKSKHKEFFRKNLKMFVDEKKYQLLDFEPYVLIVKKEAVINNFN